MKANLGTLDKVIRLLTAVILIILFYSGVLNGIVGIIFLVIALLLTLTSLLSYCPIYKLLHFNTKSKKTK